MNIKTDLLSIIKDSLMCSMMISYQHFHQLISGRPIAALSGFCLSFVLVFYGFTFVYNLILKNYNKENTFGLIYAIMLPLFITIILSITLQISAIAGKNPHNLDYIIPFYIMIISMCLSIIDILKNRGGASKDFFSIFKGQWNQNCI
jgi:hypothetical protein